jgi:hypothetical protein
MSVRFTVNEIATMAHIIGRNAETLLMSEDLTPETQEVIFKALSATDVFVTEDGFGTVIPGGTVGVALSHLPKR